MKKWHSARLRGHNDFHEVQKALLFNSRLKFFPGKLQTRWDGPLIVKQVFPHGAIELISMDTTPFKVNGHRSSFMKKACDLRKKRGGVVKFGQAEST